MYRILNREAKVITVGQSKRSLRLWECRFERGVWEKDSALGGGV